MRNRTPEEFKKFLAGLDRLRTSPLPEHREIWRKANAELIGRTKMVGPSSVHNDSTLANVSVEYANEDYIGLQLMPVVDAAKLSDKFFVYDKRSRLAVPDDAVGARGDANEISDARSTDTYSCKDYALKNYVDALTLASQDAPLNEMIDLVMALNDMMDLAEEIRIAAVLTASANFASANTSALTGPDRWDTAGGGDPIKNIQDALAAIWMGRGPSDLVAYCSLEVFNVLSRHNDIRDLFKYGGTKPGLASANMIADFFGLNALLVGKARKDTANSGQTASYARVWGSDYFGIVRVARSPGIRTASFGYTFRFGEKSTTQWWDPSKGTEGGYYARVALHEDHKVVANDTGYLFRTVLG